MAEHERHLISGYGASLATMLAAGRRSLPLGRRELFTWVIAIFAANMVVADAAAGLRADGWPGIVTGPIDAGIFPYFAWYAALRGLRAIARDEAARGWDLAVVLAAGILQLSPSSLLLWPAVSIVALYLVATARGVPAVRDAGLMLLGLSTQQFWLHPLVSYLMPLFTRSDAAMVGSVLGLVRGDVGFHDNIITYGQNDGLAVMEGCVSVHNLAAALLCWMALTRLHDRQWSWGDLGWVAGMIVLVVGLNVVRMMLMTLGHDTYIFLHDGAGSDIFNIIMTLSVIALSLAAARRGGGRPASA